MTTQNDASRREQNQATTGTMASMVGSDPLMTTEQAAAYLAIPTRTLTSWRSRNRYSGPPFVRMGGVVRYRPSDLDVWVAERVVRTGRAS